MAADPLATLSGAAEPHPPRERLSALALGAIGVVFGDIGTSPLYALKESFVGPHPLAVDAAHIYGVLSLIFWSLMLIVTIKYVFIILRADNRGEAEHQSARGNAREFEEVAPCHAGGNLNAVGRDERQGFAHGEFWERVARAAGGTGRPPL